MKHFYKMTAAIFTPNKEELGDMYNEVWESFTCARRGSLETAMRIMKKDYPIDSNVIEVHDDFLCDPNVSEDWPNTEAYIIEDNDGVYLYEKITSLKDFMKSAYSNEMGFVLAVRSLNDDDFINDKGWERAFHEGYGEGVYCPNEGVVAIFDDDELSNYRSYSLYKYNPKAWKHTANGGWDNIYAGDNGSDYEVEPISK